jgi:hypothetical protein
MVQNMNNDFNKDKEILKNNQIAILGMKSSLISQIKNLVESLSNRRCQVDIRA